MNDNAILLLSFGSFSMSLLLGYWFWTAIRRYRLRVDLLEQVVGLDEAAKRLNATNDAAYLHTRDVIRRFSENIEIVSWGTFAYFSIVKVPEPESPRTSNADLQVEIDRVQNIIGSRISDYLLYETAVGLGLRVMAVVLPRPETVAKVRDVVRRLIEPVDENCLGGGHVANC